MMLLEHWLKRRKKFEKKEGGSCFLFSDSCGTNPNQSCRHDWWDRTVIVTFSGQQWLKIFWCNVTLLMSYVRNWTAAPPTRYSDVDVPYHWRKKLKKLYNDAGRWSATRCDIFPLTRERWEMGAVIKVEKDNLLFTCCGGCGPPTRGGLSDQISIHIRTWSLEVVFMFTKTTWRDHVRTGPVYFPDAVCRRNQNSICA